MRFWTHNAHILTKGTRTLQSLIPIHSEIDKNFKYIRMRVCLINICMYCMYVCMYV